MADIVDIAVSAGSFSTLVAAVKAAGLVETLKGAGSFTVFAPTDDAFAKLPAGTVDGSLEEFTRSHHVWDKRRNLIVLKGISEETYPV